MRYICLKWIFPIMYSAILWGVNIEYIEVKTEGECNYISRYYVEKMTMVEFNKDFLIHPVNSPYAEYKLRKEIHDYLFSFDCVKYRAVGTMESPEAYLDSLTLKNEYRFPCCNDIVLLEYYLPLSMQMKPIWIIYLDSKNKWYMLSSFCGGDFIDNYNEIIRKKHLFSDMALTCRAMMILALQGHEEDCDVLKSEKELLYENLDAGIRRWILYRYNISNNAPYIINRTMDEPDIKQYPIPGYEPPNYRKRIYDKLNASGKTIDPPHVTNDENVNTVHLTIYNVDTHNLEYWEIAFDRKNDYLISIVMVDQIDWRSGAPKEPGAPHLQMLDE